MSNDDKIIIDGIVKETLPGASFKVELSNGHEVIASLAGKLRQNRIRVLLGDTVEIELSPYDVSRGVIVFRGVRRTEEQKVD
jgi:translation initiation factor IF-1